jgi:hypothetical protein
LIIGTVAAWMSLAASSTLCCSSDFAPDVPTFETAAEAPPLPEGNAADPLVTPLVRPVPNAGGLAASMPKSKKVNWTSLVVQELRFLAIEQGFRLATEQGTREGGFGLGRSYWNSVSNLHGWADGDPFYVNYIGHPMNGSVAGYIWQQNDPRFRNIEFGKNPAYWKAKLRGAVFAWAQSEQFEIGPFSEASIGKVQSQFPQQGFVDHTITPVMGLAWTLAEDSLDKYIIKRVEDRTQNPYVRLLLRMGLNPTRTFANVIGLRVPWARDTRWGDDLSAGKR